MRQLFVIATLVFLAFFAFIDISMRKRSKKREEITAVDDTSIHNHRLRMTRSQKRDTQRKGETEKAMERRKGRSSRNRERRKII